MPDKKTVTIEVRNGVISCSGNGYVRIHRLGEITWQCDEEFTLAFVRLQDNQPAWPFSHPAANARARAFTGTLKDVGANEEAPAYKYTVTVGNNKLDPIIIVDK